MSNAESIQISWFTKDIQEVPIQEIYSEIVGSEPNTINQNLKIQPAQPFLAQAFGMFNAFNSEVRKEISRIDFIITKSGDGDLPFGLFDLEPTLKLLLERIISFDKSGNYEIYRVALITKLSKLHRSLDEANKFLLNLCGMELDENNLYDFLFKFNKKKNVDGTEVNKHVTYAVETLDLLNVTFDNKAESFRRFISNILLDFNSVPNVTHTNLKLDKLWTELINLSIDYNNNPSVKFQESNQ